MRIKLLMLATVAASLTATAPARATLTLQFFTGRQTNQTVTGVPGDPTNPQTLTALTNWQTQGTFAGGPISSFTFAPGQTTEVLKVMLVDTFTGYGTGTPTSQYPTGSGYTIPDDNSIGLFQYAMKLTFNPAVATVAHDPVSNDGIATTYTVNGGGNLGTPTAAAASGAVQGTGSTNENAGYANNVFGPNFVTLGNIMFGFAKNNLANDDGTGSFVVGDPNTPIYRFTLANFVLTAAAPGAGTLTLSLPSTNPPSFSSSNGQNWDQIVWGPTLTNTYSIPVTVPVPEPSSMVLAGLVFSGIGYRLRRKKVAEVTA